MRGEKKLLINPNLGINSMNETNELIEVTVKFFAEDLVTIDQIWKPLEKAGLPPYSIVIHEEEN